MKTNSIFTLFIQNTSILLADPSVSSVNRMIKILVDLGAKRHQIHTAGTFQEAVQIGINKGVGLIISEFTLPGGSGFELFQGLREQCSNISMSQVLLTSNLSQMAVATAAEGDVDAYILKPFTVQTVMDTLVEAITEKLQPSEYSQCVEQGRIYIVERKYDDARKILEKALKLHPKPSLSLFYLAQLDLLTGRSESAGTHYAQGLAYNEIHFKCLWGLHSLLEEEENFTESYKILRRIITVFPADEGRLCKGIRLAIKTDHAIDIQEFYRIAIEFDRRSETLLKTLAAGLYICGKVALKNGDPEVALAAFDAIAISGSQFPKILGAAIEVLIDHGKFNDAEKLLKKFPSIHKDAPEYLIADLLLTAHVIPDKGYFLRQALDLYNKNIRHRRCIELMIEAMEIQGFKESQISPFREQLAS